MPSIYQTIYHNQFSLQVFLSKSNFFPSFLFKNTSPQPGYNDLSLTKSVVVDGSIHVAQFADGTAVVSQVTFVTYVIRRLAAVRFGTFLQTFLQRVERLRTTVDVVTFAELVQFPTERAT